MIAIILAVAIVLIAIVAFAAKKAKFHSDGTASSIIHWTKYILASEARTFTCYGVNRTNSTLCIMFTILSVVLVDTGFFVAGVMQHNGTEVHGMGWILVWSYVLGTVGSMAYAVGCGAHVMNRAVR